MFGSGTSAPSSRGFFSTAGSSNTDKPATGPNIFGKPQSSGFSFGQPPAGSFGGGNDKKDGGTSGPSIFGTGGGAFGQPASGNAGGSSDAQKSTGAFFGSTGAATPSIFGQSPSTGNDGKPMFGQQPSSGGSGGANIFGKQPDTTAKSTGSFFTNLGNSSQTPGTPSQSSAPKISFGSTTPAPAGTTNSFSGSSTTPAGQPPTLMFGASTGGASSQAQSQLSTQAPSFGQTETSTSGTKPGMFGAAGTPSIFGAKPADSTPPASSFGGFKLGQPTDKPAEPTTKPDVPKFSFATNTPATSSQAAHSIFGVSKPSDNASSSAPAQPAASKPPAFSFQTTSSSSSQGQTATSKPSGFTGFTLGTSTTDKPSFFPTPTTTSTQPAEQPKQTGPLFPSLGTPQSTTGTSQPGTTAPAPVSLFPSFGKPPASSAATTSATPAAPSPGPSIFSATPATSAQTSSTTAATTTPATTAPAKLTFGTTPPAAPATAPAPAAASLGVSTAGPVAPAQSRLRNRTMDEILTRWASDLTRYTKEFKGHAEQIAYWDQIIVDNSAKINRLFVKTRTCEKQTMSVEMQLSAVENQQNELESWLSKYEGDVEEMLAKDGSGQNEPGGPDQERERTYQLAERLGERLDDMGRDLQSMIEEVNAANAGLGKSNKVDEPVTQIVKILNAHLSQLQAIDQGTAALQAKVSAAQKAASGMNYLNASMNGDNRGAVDDFYRSYMGRR